ncbi:MAG: hypothetical protein LBV41_11390 [Cytophagaceae bacterium]|jgi:hypothetical protein|nr:hypothetical protein [Cytophagaceae bacterium]
MEEEPKGKKHVRGTVPRKDSDIIGVANLVVESWKKYPAITLAWITPSQLKSAVNTFATSFDDRNETKGSRITITQGFATLNTEIDASVSYIKGYVADAFGKNEAASYYLQFGLVKVGGTYKLPRDKDERLHSLDQMVKAIDRHGMSDQKYGKQYWETIRTSYAELKTAGDKSDSASAEYIAIKAESKAFIIKALNCLVLAIKANYPDTYKDVLRVCGFQKEKY